MTIQDSTRTIGTSVKRFFSGTLISRCTGLTREIAMAAVFGTHPAVAAFWMAFRFAHLLRRLFGEGALHAAFIPHFESLRKENPVLGARFFYDLSMGIALFLLLITVIVEGVLGGVVLFGSVSASNQEVIHLTMIMLPALVFISLYALNISFLNCERSYFLPSVAPTALNLVWLLAIFLVRGKSMTQAIESLSMMIVLAFALQWAVTAPQVFRHLSQTMKEKWREMEFSGREILRIIRPFALALLGVAATQINSALDAIFARAADPEGPAYLWYALRIQQLPLALLGVGLTGALLPPISRAIQKQERAQYLHFLNFALKKCVVLLLPVMAALFALGFSAVNLLYGHGEFSQNATLATTFCLWAYGSALIPMTLVLILASAFYAQKNYRIPTILSLLSVAINSVLNAIFVYVFHLGAISIALATAFSACINGACLLYFLKKGDSVDLQKIGLPFLKTLLASLFAAAVTILLLRDNTLLWLTHQKLAAFPRELYTQLTTFGFRALTFSATFLLAAYCLRLHDFLALFSKRAFSLKEENSSNF